MLRTIRLSRRRLALAAGLAAVLTAAVLPLLRAGTAQAAVAFTSTLVNSASGRCADVPNGANTSALQLIQWTCNAGNNQNFTFNTVSGQTGVYTIGTVTAGSCLDINGASTADNATVIQYACHSGTNQQFRTQLVSGSGASALYNVVSVASGKCIAPAGDGTANNVGLVQLPCTGGATRVWRLPGAGAPASPTPSATTASPTPSASSSAARTFRNPLNLHGPDPWLQYYNGYYYLATTTWNMSITMRRSRTLGGLATAADTLIMDLSSRANGCCNMWAPEFHLLTGPNGTRWYLYYTAGRNQSDYLGTQRIHVLESSSTDPMGPYTFKADLLDPTADNTWELDGSILQLNGQLYLLGTYYAGNQPMFIKPMSNPWTLSGTRRLLSTPTYSWETVGGAVNEGPEVLQHNGQTFIVFSASHCSTPDYKMGLLTYNGGDPLASSSWVKKSTPVFQRSDANGVYAPGHGGFFSSPDGTESWMVYHANNSASGGCDMNRTTRAQKFTWNADGTPNFGTPVSLSTALPVPSGEPAS